MKDERLTRQSWPGCERRIRTTLCRDLFLSPGAIVLVVDTITRDPSGADPEVLPCLAAFDFLGVEISWQDQCVTDVAGQAG